jgi:hypothetical protein
MRISATIIFILIAIATFGQNEKLINSGGVFIDGNYIESPYEITVNDENQVFINNISICTNHSLENKIQIKKRPNVPDCLSKFSSLEELNNCYLPEQKLTYVKAASLYFIENYDYEAANDSIVEYYRHLPNVESIVHKNGPFYTVKFYNGRVCTMYFSAERLRQLYPKNIKTGHIKNIDKASLIENFVFQIKSFLENNKILFFFSDEKVNNFLISDVKNASTINNIIKSKYPYDIKIDSLTKILHNKILVEKLLNYNEIDHINLDDLTTNFVVQDTTALQIYERKSALDDNAGENLVAYSPQRNKIKAFCPAFYETNTFGMFLTQEFENVKTEISSCGFYDYTLFIDYTANDDGFGYDYNAIKNMANDAGFIYIASHGGETEGVLLVRGITENGIINWITDISALSNIEIAYIPEAHRPEEWTATDCWEAYANSTWAYNNWGAKLNENKTITILSICYGANNGWMNACAGGACFGYEGTTNFNIANAHNNKLLKYMNGSNGAGQYRLASQAYQKVIDEIPNSKLRYAKNNNNYEVTLCPGIIVKFPISGSIVSSSGDGYIALDTWVDASIMLNKNSSSSPVSFSSSNNITISGLEWDNIVNGKSNRIKFSWSNSSSQNSGIVNVNINANKFQSIPSMLGEYHTLNVNVESSSSYSFQVNPSTYNENMCKISGKVYNSTTFGPLTNGTVKDTDDPANIVAINSQGQYSIYVAQGWSGSLTATVPGYASKIQPFNPVYEDRTHDFYLTSTSANIYISTTNDNPNQCPIPKVKYRVENGSGFWDYTWYLNGTIIGHGWFVLVGQFNLNENILKVDISTDNNVFYSLSKTIYVTEVCPAAPIDASISQDCSLINVGTIVHFYETSFIPEIWKNYMKRNWTIDVGGNDEIITEKKSIYEKNPYDYSCSFNSIGHKIVKLSYWESHWWDIFNSYKKHVCDAWGGVNVIDCDLTSSLTTPNEMFFGAVYDDWDYNNNNGPVYIYGGSFVFNGTANNYLNNIYPITMSACKEITINGDVEFVADGEKELVLEIKKPCNYESNNNISHIYSYNDTINNFIFENAYCYPNPFNENVNLYFEINFDNVLNIEVFDLLGKIYFKKKENFKSGSHLLYFSTYDLPPSTYIIKIFNADFFKTFKIVKQ